MKAICITDKCFSNAPSANIPSPQVGEEVTVIEEKVFRNGIDCYLLQEYTCPNPAYEWGYDKRNFAPLTGLDETELVTEEFNEKYCVPA